MITAHPRIPISTYRLQFNQAFTFRDGRDLVPYLHDLGITDCYCSSYLKATPGSLHGYDVVDPTVLNPEIGTEEDHRQFSEALHAHGMGQMLDVVPNHMGIAQSCNPWWLDVLENGPGARYANFFDIDWYPLKPELENKILLPILGDLYGIVLENQEISLQYEEGAFFIRYYDHRLPVTPKSYTHVLSHGLDYLIRDHGKDDPQIQELQSIITAITHLPPRSERDPSKVEERYREKEIIKRRLAALVKASPVIAGFLEQNLALFNGQRDYPGSFSLLDALLNEQGYRLAYWRVASEEINYRRFFDINELAAVRMEDPAVFKEAHQLVCRLVREGSVTGLRIDHVDGLYDPEEYLGRLQSWAKEEFRETTDKKRPLYLIVEKILGKDETLPDTWPIYGTTGYEFLNHINGLFVDGTNEHTIDEIYAKFVRQRLSFDDLAYEKKKLIMSASMASEINVLGHQLNRISERDRRSRDFTLNNLIHAIREIIASFPVYRTYITPRSDQVADRDRAYIRLAVMKAKRRNPAVNALVFDFVRDILLSRPEDRFRKDRTERLAFVMKFQKTTSPVTAKGIEDTALYIYNRLISLNEVGGEPQQFGLSPEEFHERMGQRCAYWPHALSATSTHDTKRSEDVRARINVLSEVPSLWKMHLTRWSKANKRFKTELDGQPVPDRNEEYFLYQTLLGAWPLEPMDESESRVFRARIQAYMAKALHEAKVHTSWVNPNEPYDQAVEKFIEAILDRTRPNPFLESFGVFQATIAQIGMYNSLAQTVLKMTAPGVPDFYQGTELWDFSLVDPDNRRPVDYARRRRLLAELRHACETAGPDRRGLIGELLASRANGRIKLYVIMTALQYRRAHPGVFLHGSYIPLEIGGARSRHLCGYARVHEGKTVLVLVPRLLARLLPDSQKLPLGREVWEETWVVAEKAGVRYRNVLTGDIISPVRLEDREVLPVGEIFKDCPVAIMEQMA